jgi:hypothetical protein
MPVLSRLSEVAANFDNLFGVAKLSDRMEPRHFFRQPCQIIDQAASLPSVQAAAAIARELRISLDELAGLSSNADPELSRLLYRLEELNDQDRALARRFLGLLLGE